MRAACTYEVGNEMIIFARLIYGQQSRQHLYLLDDEEDIIKVQRERPSAGFPY